MEKINKFAPELVEFENTIEYSSTAGQDVDARTGLALTTKVQ